jgi:hypothetical protein
METKQMKKLTALVAKEQEKVNELKLSKGKGSGGASGGAERLRLAADRRHLRRLRAKLSLLTKIDKLTDKVRHPSLVLVSDARFESDLTSRHFVFMD